MHDPLDHEASMNRTSFLLSATITGLSACNAPTAMPAVDAGPADDTFIAIDTQPTIDARAANVIGSTYALPSSIPDLAAEVRSAGGSVLVMETVSIDARGFTSATPTGIEGLFERYPTATMTVRVVDALGETAPSMFTAEFIAGPVELVDADGAPRTDWVVSRPSDGDAHAICRGAMGALWFSGC